MKEMTVRLAVLIVAAGLAIEAQMKMTVRQLTQFIESSIQLKHDDKKVASYLKGVTLSERLEARTVEVLQGLGAGPRTVLALDALVEATKSLTAAAPEAPKPVPPTIPPPSAEEQKKILDQAREYALNYSKQLPNFICVQVTRRYDDPSGLEFWRKLDTITTRLSFFEQKEDYKVILINSRPTELDYWKLGGAISAGEFGSMMKELFEPETQAQFQWERWATLRGRRMHVYTYRVAQSKSKWSINYEQSLTIVAAYKGSVFVDADTATISRVRLEADQLPPSFPVNQASIELDYDLVPIGTGQYMLPLKHTMRMRNGKYLTRNEVEFRLYRRFEAEATITFEPEPLAEDKLKEQPPK